MILTLALATQIICSNIIGDTITLETINDNSIVRGGIEYNIKSINENMTGTISMAYDFRDMNKRYNWNYVENFDINLSIARPLPISNSILKRAEQYECSISTQIKSDYQRVYFKRITDDAFLFGSDILEGKIKLNSILLTFVSGNETLFIFQSIDTKWYYVTILN